MLEAMSHKLRFLSIRQTIFGELRKISMTEKGLVEEAVEGMPDSLLRGVYPSLLDRILEEALEFPPLLMEL